MSAKPKILLLGEIVHAQRQWGLLSDIGDLILPQAKNRKDFIQECKDGKLDGVVAAYRTKESASITGVFDEELCSVLPKSWKWLCHCGAGYDSLDIDAMYGRDPPLLASNVTSVSDDAAADTAMFLILGTLRNFNASMTALRRGEWRGNVLLGHDPQGKVLGILGMGGIGQSLKKKAEAFGMSVIYHNRRRLEKETDAEYVSFEEILKRSDVLSLNLRLNDKTWHMISTEQFKLMKPSAIIINTARGALIDEAALADALASGLIAGAGLDVFENEPNIHPGLLNNEKTMLLPHLGTSSMETQEKYELWVVDNIRSALTEGKLLSPISL